MPIYDLHSKRRRKLRGDAPDVYTYDDFPEALRNQIVHIWRDVLGDREADAEVYAYMGDVIAREYGLDQFPVIRTNGRSSTIENFRKVFVTAGNFELVLDITELSFRYMILMAEDQAIRQERVDDAIEELNHRFQENAIGYQFLSCELIRVDSQLIHSGVVKPALHLLNRPEYAGAQDEFLKAHEHYRKGDGKEAMTECAKSLESLMKSICDKRKWNYDKNATAKALIKVCFDHGLIPQFWESHFSYLRSILESGVPVGRNKLSAHGAGAAPTEVPDYLVAYMLHMTASTIVFLAEAEAAF